MSAKSKPAAHIRIAADQKVICTEAFFRPPTGPHVERGRYFELSSPVVRQFPVQFAVVVPVNEVLEVE
ncbi:MAG: hypothetical protein E6F93_09255 [Actinobacteria bacterium]|nr:MAG: hypothetical protein E6F93_09255 [Actinomycetota bacterium]